MVRYKLPDNKPVPSNVTIIQIIQCSDGDWSHSTLTSMDSRVNGRIHSTSSKLNNEAYGCMIQMLHKKLVHPKSR